MPHKSNPSTPAEDSRERRVPGSTRLLLVLLAVTCCAGAVRLAQAHRRAAGPQPIDFDDAPSELAAILNKTPKRDQLDVAIKRSDDPSAARRYAAVGQLEYERGPGVLAALQHAYTDSSSEVREEAMHELPDLDPDVGRLTLVEGLVDSDESVREGAVSDILSRSERKPTIIDWRAVPTLIRALGDTDSTVRFLAVRSLSLITGKPWVYRHDTPSAGQSAVIRHWRDWYSATAKSHPVPAEYVSVQPVDPARTDPAPDFDIRDLSGNDISLDSQHGKVTLLNFWGTWCPPCQSEVPDLQRLYTDYRSRGLTVVGVAVAEHGGDEGLRKWCSAHGVQYPQTLDHGDVTMAYGDISEVPVSVLIDGEGRVRGRWEGPRDYGTFAAAVDRVLKSP